MPPRNGTESFPLNRTTLSASSTHLHRNLFQSHLTRKPTTGASGPLPSTIASASIGHPNTNGNGGLDLGSRLSEPQNDTDEIIARDVNGEVQITDPPSPTPDEVKDMGFDEHLETERKAQYIFIKTETQSHIQ